MKGIIFSIEEFAIYDGPGIRANVFFKGCPLRCLWCHNPEGLEAPSELAYYKEKCIGCGECVKACPHGAHYINEHGEHVFDREKCVACGKCTQSCFASALELFGDEVTVDELLPKLLEDRDFYESSGGGVTLSGGECLVWSNFASELLSALKKEGISTAVDTCGHISREAIDRVIDYTDVFLYDIKGMNVDAHINNTGVSNEKLLENLKYIDSRGKKIEIRIPFVPDHNDADIEAIGSFLSKLKNVSGVRVLPYHNFSGSKYEALGKTSKMGDIRIPTKDECKAAEDALIEFGLPVIRF